MLEKPDIQDEQIISCLQHDYGLHAAELTFLPIGADLGTAVYRVVTDVGTEYFLKLRKGFQEITVTVPLFLKSQGIKEIIVPLETMSKRAWAEFGEYTMILYPFVHGKDGFESELTDVQRRKLGAALKALHRSELPPELKRQIPKETFSAQWREMLKSSLKRIQSNSYIDGAAASLAEFMRSKRGEISHLIERTEELASEIKSTPLELALCHADIHGGNILITQSGELYIVDWDTLILAPRERDLMFIGGGIDRIWKGERDINMFYEGYGQPEIHIAVLAYYRYERIIEDLAVTCEQLLLSDKGGADREQAYQWFTGNFEPGSTIEIARDTDRR